MKKMFSVLLLLFAFLISCTQENRPLVQEKVIKLCSLQIDHKKISIDKEWRLLMTKNSFPYFKKLDYLKIEALDKRKTVWKVFYTISDISFDSNSVIFTARQWDWGFLGDLFAVFLYDRKYLIPVPYTINHSFLP